MNSKNVSRKKRKFHETNLIDEELRKSKRTKTKNKIIEEYRPETTWDIIQPIMIETRLVYNFVADFYRITI